MPIDQIWAAKAVCCTKTHETGRRRARKMTFRSKTITGFTMALAILVSVCVLSYRGMTRTGQDRDWVTHTNVVLERLDVVLADATEAESAQRGYIITGDEAYLESFRNAVESARQEERRIRQLTSDNAVQQRAMDGVERLLAEKFAALEEVIETRREVGLAAASDTVSRGADGQRMERLRIAVARMREEEERLLAQRSKAWEDSRRITRGLIFGGNGLALLFLALAGVAIQQEMARRKRAEDEVRRANTELEERVAERTAELGRRAEELARSNGELEQFAYVASHDLQEPLRMVASFTQLLGKRYGDKLDDDGRDFIHYAVDGAKRMQNLISDLLSFSRVGTRESVLEPTSCDFVLKRALGNLALTIEENGAEITWGALPQVVGDAKQLSQVFQNLIGNAIKFCNNKPPRVEIQAEPDGDNWKISVRDNGIGISPEQASRIFVIFQRLHTRAEYPGTGIGLSICKKIVERHGGRIWMEGSPGGGSTFCFTLPAAKIQGKEARQYDDNRVSAASR